MNHTITFTDIYEKHEKPVYNYVLRMVRDQEAAKDLTQDIFIKVYHKLTSFKGDAQISSWLYRIATNAYVDYLRTKGYRQSTVTDPFEENEDKDSDNKIVKKVLSIEDQFVKSNMNACIKGFLDNLPEDYRAVIVLHDLQGFKNREIADILNCSLGTVKIRLHRARNKFRGVLASNCDFYRNSDSMLSCDRKGN
jgi:RNA polymerase sigma-70 factor, ECF subfamily